MEEAVYAFQRFLLAQHGVQHKSNDESFLLAQHGVQHESNDASSMSHKAEGFKHNNANKGDNNKSNNTWRDVLLVVNILALVVVAISVWLK